MSTTIRTIGAALFGIWVGLMILLLSFGVAIIVTAGLPPPVHYCTAPSAPVAKEGSR